MEFREEFTRFIRENSLFSPGQPVLLTVSGGVDSVVMAHLFYENGFTFGIAHCNFQLRGEESEGDAAFVRELAAKYQAPFFTKRFDTQSFATQNGLSIQMAARELRYRWFQELAADQGYPVVATAHHLNDSVETSLLNFVRGTGLSGLSGIRMKWQFPGEQAIWLVRPLLFATRESILGHARVCGLEWREDSSNAEDYYARNYIRHHLVTGMTELNPSFLSTAGRNLRRISEARENLAFLTRQFLGIPEATPENEMKIEVSKLKQLPAPRQALAIVLKPLDFDQEQIRQVAKNMDFTGFRLQSKSGWQVLCDRGSIHISHPESAAPTSVIIKENDLMIRLPDGGSVFFVPTQSAPLFSTESHEIVVEAHKLVYPLMLRRWQPGDVFQPFGMNGKSQKLQDYFTNEKLSRTEKDQAWMLVNGDGAIIWVIGRRMDERFRVPSGGVGLMKVAFQPG